MKETRSYEPSYPAISVLPSRHPYEAIFVRLTIYYIVSSAT